jgi:hypothetical protein
LSGTYGAGLIWFLKNNLIEILINYWEYLVIYTIVLSLIGLFAIRLSRGHETSKHLLTVSVKWLIRFLGVILVYNASASPLSSLLMLFCLFFLYFFYALNKWVFGKLFSKKQDNKKKVN